MKTVFLASVLLFSVTAVVGDSNHQLFLRHSKTREEIAPQDTAAVADIALVHGRELQTCQYCGGGVVGNGVCSVSSQCCSTYGWCGTTSEYCGTAGSCGGGSLGNGICSNRALCCSTYGYCGNTTEHCRCSATNPGPCTSPRCGLDWSDANSKCGTPCTTNAQCTVAGEECYADVSVSLPCCSSATTAATTTTAATIVTPSLPPPISSGDKARLITFVGNWQRCPTLAEIANYTHVVVAFSVAYTWNNGVIKCSSTCVISEPPTCGNAVRKDLITQWKAAGKTVLLSFGGANMGGSWLAPPNGCWENCYSKASYVIQRLKDLVTLHGYNGVDIDYEYYYDNKNGFNKGTAARNFLTNITAGLKDKLPAGSNIVTHAPMDADVVKGTGYYNLLKSLAQTGKLDFLMPQYYNGVSLPVSNFAGTTLPHYTNLVQDMFGGNAKRVVFGFCVAECGKYNTTGAQAASIMIKVGQSYPCNGGAYFWEFLDDMPSNAWSSPVKAVLQNQSISCP